MSQFNAVKSQSKSFMFKRVFDNFNINTSFHSSDCEKDPKNPLNDINNENLNLKDAIRKIVGWKVFSYGLAYSIVDSLCRFVISIGISSNLNCVINRFTLKKLLAVILITDNELIV